MKGFPLLATAALVAIGVGVAVESTGTYGPPTAVTQAIRKTESVSSVEITMGPPNRPPNAPAAIDHPAVYNAPDRYQSQGGFIGVAGVAFPTVFIGNAVYVSVPNGVACAARFAPASSPSHQCPAAAPGAPRPYLELVAGPSLPFGALSAKRRAFEVIQGVLEHGSDFQRANAGYRFRLSVDITQHVGSAGGAPTRLFELKETGGTVTLVDGYVHTVTWDEVIDGQRSSVTVGYGAFNRAPRVQRPTDVQRCEHGAKTPRTEAGWLCQLFVHLPRRASRVVALGTNGSG
jgi:hypothetical protein